MAHLLGRPPPAGTTVVQSTFDKAAYSAYESVKAERDALKEAEIVYKRRIQGLEEESKSLLKSYQDLYAENKVLKSKVEHGPDSQRIRRFRDEIKRLEDKANARTADSNLLKDEVYALQKEINQKTEEKKRLDDAFKMERELHVNKSSTLEKENKELEEKVEKLERQQQEYEFRIKNYEEESDGLLNRYKELKRDNLKMESKFKSQKDLVEEELRETKEINKEVSKEVIKLKTKLAKLESEHSSIKLDYEAAKRQLDFQYKELEVYKHQSSHLQQNAKASAREYNRMEEELRSAEEMLADARTSGFDAVLEERKRLIRKEKRHLERISELELQVEELSRENTQLDRQCNVFRAKLEASIMKEQDLTFAEAAYKRKIEALLNENIELDRQGKFLLGKQKKSVLVTMTNDNIKTLEKEKQAMQSRIRVLEIMNKKLERKVKELDGKDTDDLDDDFQIVSLQSKRRNSERLIRAEMPSLGTQSSSYRKKVKSSRSLPSIRSYES